MAVHQGTRERAASDQAENGPVAHPRRPGLPDRTTSAPPGGLRQLEQSRIILVPPEGGHHARDSVNGDGETGQVLRQKRTDSLGALKSSSSSSSYGVLQKPSRRDLPQVTIAIVGEDRVGKSTFIRCALDMTHPPFSPVTTKRMSLDGTVYMIRLLEFAAKTLVFDDKGRILSPPLGKGQPSHSVLDGLLVLFDATDPTTLSDHTELLDSLTSSSIPFALAACKCDVLSRHGNAHQLMSKYGNHEIHKTSSDAMRSQKMCIAAVLRSIVSQQQHNSSLSSHLGAKDNHFPPRSSSRTRAQLNNNNNNRSATRDLPQHGRTTSAISTAVTAAPTGGEASAFAAQVDGNGVSRPPSDHSSQSTILALNAHGSRYARSNSQPVRPQTPTSGGTLVNHPRRPSETTVPPHHSSSPSTADRKRQSSQVLHTIWRHSAGSDAFNTFLDVDDEMDESQTTLVGSDGVTRDRCSDGGGSHETGLTFDELVDRLVSMPLSKQDTKFAAIFLCLYRKFAAPLTLLNAVVARFERNEKNSADQLTWIADQLRLLNIIALWASEYPGDFAHPKTRKRISDFVSTLEKSPFYMFAAKEIGSYLEVPVDDDDVGWPFRDGGEDLDPDAVEHTETFYNNSGRSSPSIFLSGPPMYEDEEEVEEEDPIYHMNALDLSEDSGETSARISGATSVSSAGKSNTTINQSFTLLSIESAQREASSLDLTPKIPLSKILWRQFMEIPDEDFARELTRMDWIMYNSFRPRDLVRHVSLSGDKEKVKSLENVNRMIRHFNHLAFFVASMILLRDKPKHRAKALEKFMSIASKLRRQNNYNSLGAVIAGINGTPVLRLGLTRDLIPLPTQKDFMRLVILMGTQRGHFAYRLAWENSFSERIPFLPLHRRDLVSAEEGNRTFLGENKQGINWKKFEIIGEVVLGIQRSQRTPHTYMAKCEEAQRLILETKLSGDEEDLYARSLQVEPAVAGGDLGRKKFSWLRAV